MRRDVVWIVCTLLCAGAGADEQEVRVDANDAPDIEFLEYLGGLVRQDDAWIGPDDMTVAPSAGHQEVSDSAERPEPQAEELQ